MMICSEVVACSATIKVSALRATPKENMRCAMLIRTYDVDWLTKKNINLS